MLRNILLFVATVFAGTVHAAVGSWSSTGPSGGSVSKIEFHVSNPSIAYAGGEGGFFRSSDGGLTWATSEVGLPPGMFNPTFYQARSNGNILYMLTSQPLNRLFRSNDAGLTWNILPPIVATGAPAAIFLSISPANPDLLVVAFSNEVRISTNGGTSFSNTAFPPAPFEAASVAVYGTTVLLGGRNPMGQPLLYRSTNGGGSFFPTGVQNVSIEDTIVQLKFSRGDPNVVYLGYQSGGTAIGLAGRSIDNGQTWTPLTDPNISLQRDFWISQAQPQSIMFTKSDRLYTSANGGVTLTQLGSITEPSLVAVSAIFGYPTNPVLLVGTNGRGIIRSANNGTLWNDSYLGYQAYLARALAIPNNAPNTVFAGQGDAGFRSHALQRSINGGGTWVQGTLNSLANSVRGLTIDPTSAGQTIYAVGRLFPPAIQNGGIYKSIDGGVSWTAISVGIPAQGIGRSMGNVRSVVLDPRSCVSPPPSGPCISGPLRTIYVLGSGRQDGTSGGWLAAMVYKSLDAGATWTRADSGLPSPGPGFDNFVIGISLVMDANNPGTLYAGLSGSYGNLGVPNGVTAGIYKTINGGASWNPVNSGLPSRPGSAGLPPDVLSLAIDPVNPQIVYAGITIGDVPGAPLAGIYKTVNGGSSWTNASNGVVGADVRALLVDRNTPNVVYAASIGTFTSPGGVYKTVNNGANWRSISSGLLSSSVFALARDPADPATLYAGTNTGVWKLTQVVDGDGDGAGTTTENAAPNAGDGNNDGIADANQQNVASTINAPITRGRINYVTVGGTGAIAPDQPAVACDQLTDVYSIDPRIFPPDPLSPLFSFNHDEFGLINVEVANCSTLNLTVRFHDGTFNGPNWTWRNYGPTTPGDDATVRWYPYPNAVKLDATTWRISLTAGQVGSWRANNSNILFRGGPAFFADQLLRDGFE